MTLGQKIRDARRRVGMTQSELAGNRISRNMLSMIENDRADPSYKTILYLADRLAVPVCFFFEEEADLAQSRRRALMPRIYEKLKRREFNACLALCAELSGLENDEIYLIKAECYFHIGLQACRDLSFGNACDAFLTAQSNAAHSVYPTEYIEVISRYTIAWMNEFSHSGNPFPKTPTPPIEPDATQYYLWLLPLIGTIPDALVEEMLQENIPRSDITRQHIRARIKMRSGHYESALELLQDALSETDVSLLRFLLLSDMETAYTQMKDYENAYIVSQQHRDLVRKLHAEARTISSLLSAQ